MESIMLPIMTAALAFGGLLVGGTVGITARSMVTNQMYSLYAFCGGMLAGLLTFELIPETLSEYEMTGLFLGGSIGILLMVLLHMHFHHSHHQEGREGEAWRSFLFLSLAIYIHNVPTGVAFGISMKNFDTAIPFLFAAVIHHIPEGLALAIPFLFTRFHIIYFLLTITLLSLVLGVGTVLGSVLRSDHIHLNSMLMGLAIGTLGYVTVNEMLLKAQKKMSVFSFFLLAGGGLVLILLYIENFIQH